MLKKTLTVTVPAYNAEKYLANNLKSFCIPEIMEDLEVLIINDGSADGTKEVAEQYAKQYPEVFRVISKENGGHGSGINTGIDNANGKYFKVVDADDWVTHDGIILLMETLRRSRSDLVFSGFLWAFDRGEKDVNSFRTKAEIKEPFAGVEYGKEYAFDEISDRLYLKMHNVSIRTEILKNSGIRIDEHCYYVDSEYVLYPVPYIHTIRFLNETVYLYRIGTGGQSVSMDKMRQNLKNFDQVMKSLLSFYSSLNETNCSTAKKRYIAGGIARVAASKIKTMLSFPPSGEALREIRTFEQDLKTGYPEIYRANLNRAVSFLRKTDYLFYREASWAVRKKYQ